MTMTQKKVSYEFDPFELAGLERPKTKSALREALNEIRDYIRTEVLQYVGEGKSPVAGGPFKKSLSADYKKLKEKISSSGIANLELTGDMLDALECVVTSDGTLVLQVTGSEAPKAYNHNVGDTLPQRQFVPMKGETFKSPIIKGMKEIAEAFAEDDE